MAVWGASVVAKKVLLTPLSDGRVSWTETIGRGDLTLPVGPESLGTSVSSEWDDVILVGGGIVPTPKGNGGQSVLISCVLPYTYTPTICSALSSSADFVDGGKIANLVEALGSWGDKVRVRIFDSPTHGTPFIDQTGYMTDVTRTWRDAFHEQLTFNHISTNEPPFQARNMSTMSRGALSRVSSDALLALVGVPASAPFTRGQSVETWCRTVLYNASYAKVIAAHNSVDEDGFYIRDPASGEVLKRRDPRRSQRPDVLLVPDSIRGIA